MDNLYFGNVPDNILDLYRVLRTGDQNGYIVFNKILIDVGVPKLLINPYLYDLEAVFLTHRHSDHFNLKTLKSIQSERPDLPVFCGRWLVDKLVKAEVKNINIIDPMSQYTVGGVTFLPFPTVHNVPSVGYYMFDEDSGKGILHATDLGRVPPISAHNADIVALEFNHDAVLIEELLEEETAKGQFSHYYSSRYNHLSFQEARTYIDTMTKGQDKITVVKLHTSEAFKHLLPIV